MAAKKRARGKGGASTKRPSSSRASSKKVDLTPTQKALVEQLAARDRELEELRKKLKEAEEKAEKKEIKETEKKVVETKKTLEKKAEATLQKLEDKVNEEQKRVDKGLRELEQHKAVEKAVKSKKKKKKRVEEPVAAIYRPEEPRPERPEIKLELPPPRVRRKPRIRVVGETIAERMKRADEMIEMLRDQKRKLREDLRRLESTRDLSDEKKELAEQAAEKIRGFLENVKEEMRLNGYGAYYRVVANMDATVDAEVRIPLVLGTDIDTIRNLLIVLEETFGDGIDETQWVSVGFTADPKINEDGVLRSAREYVAHEGQIRFNTAYQEAAQKLIGYGFLVGEKALTGFVNAYGPKVNGILVRIAWSQSGRLFRLNDQDLRKPKKSKKPLRKSRS